MMHISVEDEPVEGRTGSDKTEAAMSLESPNVQPAMASLDDVRRVFGELDEAKLLDILALRPTVLDLENASISLAGDRDVFGAGEPLPSIAGDIIAILTADEADEAQPT